MIGFSIVMWFTSFVTFMVAASLLRGNTAKTPKCKTEAMPNKFSEDFKNGPHAKTNPKNRKHMPK